MRGSPSGSVPVTSPVTMPSWPVCSTLMSVMNGALLVGGAVVSGMVIVRVVEWGSVPVNREMRVARPWMWGPLSEILTVNWSAAVVPGVRV